MSDIMEFANREVRKWLNDQGFIVFRTIKTSTLPNGKALVPIL